MGAKTLAVMATSRSVDKDQLENLLFDPGRIPSTSKSISGPSKSQENIIDASNKSEGNLKTSKSLSVMKPSVSNKEADKAVLTVSTDSAKDNSKSSTRPKTTKKINMVHFPLEKSLSDTTLCTGVKKYAAKPTFHRVIKNATSLDEEERLLKLMDNTMEGFRDLLSPELVPEETCTGESKKKIIEEMKQKATSFKTFPARETADIFVSIAEDMSEVWTKLERMELELRLKQKYGYNGIADPSISRVRRRKLASKYLMKIMTEEKDKDKDEPSPSLCHLVAKMSLDVGEDAKSSEGFKWTVPPMKRNDRRATSALLGKETFVFAERAHKSKWSA